MRSIRRIVVPAALVSAALVVATPATAHAATATGGDFGEHVRVCAQTMGFTGSHNPGMHQGYAGWNGMPCVCQSP
jgi:Spy/CpxP family protein refolding chaperone